MEGIFQSTPDGRFLMANPSLAQMLRYDSPESLVSTVTNIGLQLYADPKKRDEVLAELNRSGGLRGFETELICRDGSVISVSVNAREVRDQQEPSSIMKGRSRISVSGSVWRQNFWKRLKWRRSPVPWGISVTTSRIC